MEIAEKINLKIFLLFGLFPLLPSKLKGLPVVLILAMAIYYFNKNKFKNFDFKSFLFLSSLFIINIFSLLNTFSFPVKNIETILSLILIPLAFSSFSAFIFLKQRRIFIISFILASFVLAICHLIYFFSIGLFSEGVLKVNSFRIAVSEIPIINDHPIYISCFLSIALLFLLKIGKGESKKKQIFLFIFSLLIIFDLFLMSSKGVLIALFCSIFIYLFIVFKSLKIRVISLGLLFIFFITSIFYFPTLERRFRELKIKSTYTIVDSNNSSSIRFGIYKCAIKTIKENPIFG